MTYKTEQEQFWAGEFGDSYRHRNDSESLLYSKVAMWSKMLRSANNVTSALELGCNIGLNLVALKKLKPSLSLTGYEINKKAAEQAEKERVADIFTASILEKIHKITQSRRARGKSPGNAPRRATEDCVFERETRRKHQRHPRT